MISYSSSAYQICMIICSKICTSNR